ncbi:NAD-dependent epimerase/dehydratase family protein [Parachlamydia acanthamoebae]|uniref:NAD-dependent epimerase/dehydratase family protein n=1 Tax=Parachlamydia acanthamoebae TaxID=83552 RepID=UPI000751189A|nr:NAD(P)-dependent oxidoreductase [Parachlamydia acanthamoebae]
MRILFTGASSFSGMWMVKQLADQGHQVTAIFKRSHTDYSGTRGQRVQAILPFVQAIFNCSFGSQRFLELTANKGPWDLFCHHAADVQNYKSPEFDVGIAVANNVSHLKQVLEALLMQQCKKVVLTGTVFEQNEGDGTYPLKAFSPYGLSKGLTSEIFRFYTEKLDMKLGKFVIPNPFGPYEEPRFTAYLVQKWFKKEVAAVSHPSYVRDNIHVALLAKAYVHFIENLKDEPGFEKLNPSGYVESQGSFTKRFSSELRPRLDLSCEFELHTQTDYSEPKERYNTDPLRYLEWDEQKAWDELAVFYQQTYGSYKHG